MAVDQTGDDRLAPERPQRQWRTARGEAFLAREEWALRRTGEENEPAVADADRAEFSSAVFGQTCPIETAVDSTAVRSKRIWPWHHLELNGQGVWPRTLEPLTPLPGWL